MTANLLCMSPLQLLFGTSDDLLRWLHNHGFKILAIVLVALILIWIVRLLAAHIVRIAAHRPDSGREQQLRTLATVVNSSFTGFILLLAAFEILVASNVPVGPLLTGAGVAGLAIGFGAQTLVKDLITGFFVLLDDQYRVGDTIRAAGVQGTVERLTLRRTVLRDGDGSVHFIPNSDLQVVTNLTRDWRLAQLRVAVHYREDSDKVIAALRAAGRAVRADVNFRNRLLADVVVPGIDRINGDEVDYLLQCRTLPSAHDDLLRALRAAVRKELTAAGIAAWYPQVNLPLPASQAANP